MKYLFFSLSLMLLTGSDILFSQTSPLDPVCTFNYQAVLRDVDNSVLPNQTIRVQFTILDGPGANELYVEQHDVTTSDLGLFVLEIGGGTRIDGSVNFEVIPWLIRRHFLRVEVDVEGGANFELLGESPFLAVPIAVQSKVASVALVTLDTIKIYDSLNVNILCVDSLKATKARIDTIITKEVKAEVICTDSIKAESIDMVIGGAREPFAGVDPLFGGILVNFDRMSGTVDADTIKLSKVQAQDICGEFVNLRNTQTGDIVNVLGLDLFTEEVLARIDRLKGCTRADTLKVTHLEIEGDDPIVDTDSDPTNEIQQISKDGPAITLDKGGMTVVLDDDNATNELQEISKDGAVISLDQNGGNVQLLDDDPNNELQDLMLNNDRLGLNGSEASIPISEFSPWQINGSILSHEGKMRAGSICLEDQTIRIEDGTISVAYPNGNKSDAVQITTNGNGPVITLMDQNDNILGGIRADGEGGVELFSNSGKAAEKIQSNQPRSVSTMGTETLNGGRRVVEFPKDWNLQNTDPNTIKVIVTPQSASSKGLAVVNKSNKSFEVIELFEGDGSYTFDYSVQIIRSEEHELTITPNNEISTVEGK